MYSSLDSEPQRRKSQKGAIVAGLIFGIACWLMVSVAVDNNEDCPFRFLFCLPFVGAIIGPLIVLPGMVLLGSPQNLFSLLIN